MASGGGSQNSSLEERRSSSHFYCHQCQARATTITDFTCGTCGSGFIEEIAGDPDGSTEDSSLDEDDLEGTHTHQLGIDQIMEHIFTASMHSPATRGTSGGRRSPRGHHPPQGRHQIVMGTGDQFIQMLLSNLTGVHFGGQGGGGFVPIMPLYGNPGDYAWGRGGLDAVVTSLLNQMEGAGPPPMPQEVIGQIPKVKVKSSQVEAKSQCSVCWDDFSLDEEVLKLVCDHFFHEGCITPWLKLHATCPVCRESQYQPGEQDHPSVSGTSASTSEIIAPLYSGESSYALSSSASASGPAVSSSVSRGPSTATAPEAAASAALGDTISTVLNQFFGIPSPTLLSSTSSSSSDSTPSSSASTSTPTSTASTSNQSRNQTTNQSNNDSFKDMDLE